MGETLASNLLTELPRLHALEADWCWSGSDRETNSRRVRTSLRGDYELLECVCLLTHRVQCDKIGYTSYFPAFAQLL